MRATIGAGLAAALLLTVSSSSAQPPTNDGFGFGFERPSANGLWTITGSAGFDFGAGLAHEGQGNAWIRATGGWNALTYDMNGAPPNWPLGNFRTVSCRVSAWVRGSENVTGFFVSLLDATTGRIYAENGPLSGHELGRGGYIPLVANLSIRTADHPPESPYPGVRFGFWGNGQDAWVQIDDVRVNCVHGF